MKDFVQEGAARPSGVVTGRANWSRWPSLGNGSLVALMGDAPFIGTGVANMNAELSAPPASSRLSTTGSLKMSQAVAGAVGGGRSVVSQSGYAIFGKRCLDIALVLLTLPISLPLILMAALALWLEGGNPFYTQDRLGQRGRIFSILKLRTMVRNAEQLLERHLASDPAMRREWDETQKLKEDPRITPVGRFLRTTSLDELPQLWNVLIGEMSLVGPRPMMPDQLPLYGDATAYFDLKPGITGLWQVSVRNESGFTVRARADADYHADLCLRTDVDLICRTVGVVLRGTGY
ncbi:Sugar transferase involved in lipopolysaccharide synthesis [Phaeobacter gallaeciensis]|uniref:Sugar transferase involved in lipopolysaccharide synthesis n=2 Tax=Phaeobacter gallaeciensis TaxID=60890 RepID=A0AAC9ZBL9_9RHOB|nr:Sugar transferase involved in lipopolysaccharide synthesis [Phaeobacter gallaeciensis DSM 26640]ATE93974.1 Sugar transferase involved in lipopolysaccharide synthesis [Phaeobacter gallaeciensis]ATE96205.1 Sugar transferase involved in lipopolysaccharide synthesis [Phaeobacter gallaeciensis]ATF02638.1 Sugar transferase involved in lipopolysaccharide synthesis [Phaeobacter gallaeciensis]ATF07018.1 Sugar transferase involved in lipopolysaccharide synthesis [Phaeobacter gallaeciensis]